jgi:hypothetical protein
MALLVGSGTVPWGYDKLRGEQQGDLADRAVCTGCLTS